MSLRRTAEYGVFWATTRTLDVLPHRWARGLGSAVGELVWWLDSPRRRIGRRNLEIAFPEGSRSEHNRRIRHCYHRQGSIFLDVLSSPRLDPVELCGRLRLEGWQHLQEAEADGRGLIILSGHQGVYDLIAQVVALYRGPVALVARPTGNARIDREVTELRQRLGNRLLPKRGAVWGMLEILRGGGRVALLVDQRVHPNDGIEVPFFGRMSWTSPYPARISLRTGAPAVPMFAYQQARGGYLVTAHPPIRPEGEGEEAVASLTERYLATIEREVRRHPGEWLWMHDRWRRH